MFETVGLLAPPPPPPSPGRAKGVFSPRLHNDPIASCSLINFNFLQSHTEHFDKSIILPFFVFATFGFLLSVFFIHFKQ